jgi:hypothetical protein
VVEIRSGEEEMRTVMSSIWAELEGITKRQVEDFLVSIDNRTQGIQVEIEIMKALVETTWRELEAKIAEVLYGLELLGASSKPN